MSVHEITDSGVRLLRPGLIGIAELEAVIGKVELGPRSVSAEAPAAAGAETPAAGVQGAES